MKKKNAELLESRKSLHAQHNVSAQQEF